MAYPKHLNALIGALRRFPGVGTRTAERYAFQMLEWQAKQRQDLANAIEGIDKYLKRCQKCGCLSDTEGCLFCTAARQSTQTVCVIAAMRDAFSIEETGTFRGLYHVLGGLLSPMEGLDASHLSIDALLQRISSLQLKEVILALDATLEGDATSLYLKEKLEGHSVKVSRLAFGMPMGSSFAYVDGSTLARAFTARSLF